MRGRPVGGSLAAVACLLLAACGDSTTTSTTGFLNRARHVCRVYYDAAYALAPPVGLAELRAYPERQQALRRQRLTGLRAVTAPADRRAAYESYLSTMTRLDAAYATAIADLRAAHPKSIRSLVREAGELERTLDTEATALGLAKCAEDPYSATHTSSSGSG